MMEWPVTDPRDRITRAFELCLARKPTNAEISRLEKLYLDQVTLARASPEAAGKLSGRQAQSSNSVQEASATCEVAAAEAASLVALSQVLLNLDEFTTRE